MIPQGFIQDLLARVDIADVVGRHVKLRKAGANMIGLCPFHGEKSPSFTVSPSKQFYHCFGCQAHGSAIGFLMEHAGLSFVEAVEDLARELGLEVPHEKGTPGAVSDAGRPNLIELLGQAARYYQRRLRESPNAIDYLKSRGLSGKTAARFALGYSPPGWQNLEAVAADYADAAWEEAGLVKTNADQAAEPASSGAGRQNKRYDRFRDRIMFPIRSPRGGVIGFGARILHQGEPKYLNSPETPVFSKGRELYGLYEGRQALREKNQAIVVEGYMDVVMLAEHGVDNAVATLGTATTPDHVRKLLRQVDHLVFSFDGDKAGLKAAWRALTACLPMVSDTQQASFLFLPDGADPDSFVREFGQTVFYERVDSAMPMSSFLVQGLTDDLSLESPEGRARMLAAARPLLLSIGADGLRLQLRHQIAELAQVGLAELDKFLAAGEAEPAKRTGPAPGEYDSNRAGAAGDGDQRWQSRQNSKTSQNGQSGRSERSGRQRGDGRTGGSGRGESSRGGRSFVRAQPRAGRPNLDRRLRLLSVCFPSSCAAVLETTDPVVLGPDLTRWFQVLAALPPAASPQAGLEALRPQGFPEIVEVERDLAAQFGGIAQLTPEEAFLELEGALEQLERRATRLAAINMVETGLQTEEERRIHRELLASKR
ncbi:MAG: DNA primase [Burkholderiaceae bacterium]